MNETPDDGNDRPRTSPIVRLTPDEQRVLERAVDVIRADVVKSALKEVRLYLLLVVGALTVFGFFTLSGVRSDIVKTTAAAFANDGELKQQIANDTKAIIAETTKVLEEAEKLKVALNSESARISRGLAYDVSQIRAMVIQIREDAEAAAKATVPSEAP